MSPPFVQVAWPSATTDFTGFESITQSTAEVSSDFRFGWLFTVGATGITVTDLRVWTRSATTQRVRIHRVSDGVLMATADILGVNETWAEGSITPVALAASTQYVVSNRRAASSAGLHAREPTSQSFATQITYDGSVYGYGSTGDEMPATASSVLYSSPDFRFTV